MNYTKLQIVDVIVEFLVLLFPVRFQCIIRYYYTGSELQSVTPWLAVLFFPNPDLTIKQPGQENGLQKQCSKLIQQSNSVWRVNIICIHCVIIVRCLKSIFVLFLFLKVCCQSVRLSTFTLRLYHDPSIYNQQLKASTSNRKRSNTSKANPIKNYKFLITLI